MKSKIKNYSVNLIKKKQLIITGKGDSILWKKAQIMIDFCSPWKLSDSNKIEFKALTDNVNFYFNFTVFDSEIHLEKDNDSLESINNSDRVELFFRTNTELNPYYCLEIDSAARIMDFKAYPDKDFDFDWNWPQDELIVKSSTNLNSFTVEGSISIRSLTNLNLITNNNIEVGVFRAKYKKESKGLLAPTWITWVNPNTETPNFHIASSFGQFILQTSENE
jgi:hypothetical protein